MNKIICEVCGTNYHDAADHCPICGYSRDGVRKPLDRAEMESAEYEDSTKRKKMIFDFDEANPDDPEETTEDGYDYSAQDAYEQYEQYEDSSKPNVFLVVFLVIVITGLLIAIGFLLFRFYLPNQTPPAAEPVITAVPTTVATEPEETTEPAIPCTSLVLTSGVTELNKEGQYWLLHVTVHPADTTDTLIFTSEDESVVTVNEHGRITAVGEGETTVFISCGEKEIKCRVVVDYSKVPATEAVTDEPVLPESVEHEQIPAEETQQTEPNTEPAETEAAEPEKEVVLKLEDTDKSSNKRGVSFELKLACDLKPEDVTWLTLDSSVAIVRNGVVTTIGPGQTKIVAQYKGQQVECIIRCNF